MGADLYIQVLHEPLVLKWEPELEAASIARTELRDEPSIRAAQARYDHAWEEMNSRGYFRDSYNSWNLLWKFGLSWWTDVIPMLDEDDLLSPQQAVRLLDMLTEREPRFEVALEGRTAAEENHFRERYAELQRFLREAIALKQPIVCSL